VIIRRLAHSTLAWERQVDVVVIGSGVAGLMVALTASRVGSVLLLTKAALDAGSTSWAQGGIAAAIDIADTPEQHLNDTLVAGAGLCSEQAVRVLVEEGPQRLATLISFGAKLDTDDEGHLSLTREGGHNRARIVHAGGDATGAEVQRALQEAVRTAGNVEIVEDAFVLDILRSAPNKDGKRRAAGVISYSASQGTGVVRCRAICLATGGVGQVFASTTNPPVATGDGVALALRAGARVADLEFVQFHPTVLFNGPGATGQQLLVSEAVRGEGAILVDASGARVMEGVHPLADLAPRDVVAKAMSVRMASNGEDHLYLDATGLGEATLLKRFPNIVAGCRALGIDPVTQPIPVSPGEHFLCGGVRTDRNGRTDLSGLFAIGETACTGVHGANRLASNSLLEGLVYGERVGAQLTLNLASQAEPVLDNDVPADVLPASDRAQIGLMMSRHSAVRRSGESLAFATAELAAGWGSQRPTAPDVADWEATNVHTVAAAILAGATERTESRGCHWREDHPDTSDTWRVRITTRLAEDGTLEHGRVGLEETL
jgi:L-aspartate oxidase